MEKKNELFFRLLCELSEEMENPRYGEAEEVFEIVLKEQDVDLKQYKDTVNYATLLQEVKERFRVRLKACRDYDLDGYHNAITYSNKLLRKYGKIVGEDRLTATEN